MLPYCKYVKDTLVSCGLSRSKIRVRATLNSKGEYTYAVVVFEKHSTVAELSQSIGHYFYVTIYKDVAGNVKYVHIDIDTSDKGVEVFIQS